MMPGVSIKCSRMYFRVAVMVHSQSIMREATLKGVNACVSDKREQEISVSKDNNLQYLVSIYNRPIKDLISEVI